MKLLTTIHNLENVSLLMPHVDGFIVGVKGFSTRETSYLEMDELTLLNQQLNENNKELYLSFKPFLHNQGEDLKKFLASLKLNIKGIIIGDISYFYLLKDLNIPLIYNPETLITNTFDMNIFFKTGLKGVFLSKEINLEDIKEMAKNKEGNIFMVGHGHLNMFYSKRSLLTSYFKEINKEFTYKGKTLLIKEEKRSENLPIIEDDFGTHVYRSKISTVIDYLEDLANVDYLLVDSLFYDDEYSKDILKMFSNKKTKEEIINKYNQEWDNGFLTTKTIYKRNEND